MAGRGDAKLTRSSLVRLARRLDQVERGSALLHKRRDALVVELFARVRPGIDARRQIDQQSAQAYAALVDALAAVGRSELAACAWPTRELHFEIPAESPPALGPASPQHAATPTLVRSAAARAMVPGQFHAAAGKAAQAFEKLLETLLASAPEEFTLRTLGRALARTTRQVNVLEQRVAVDLTRTLVQVRRTLDEREREEAVRLRRIAAGARR
jgi:V/A-type H+-transporting ATPase subunit D